MQVVEMWMAGSGPWPKQSDDDVVVAVAVCASDPISARGAERMLGKDRRLKLLREDELAAVEVIVVVEECVDERVFARLRELRAAATSASPGCVVVSDRFRPGVLMRAIECGVLAVLTRAEVDRSELVRVVLAVNKGDAYLPPQLQGTLFTCLDQMVREVLEPNGLSLSGLSSRERDVLRLLADGYLTEEIGRELGYSGGTVKNVLYDLMSRNGLRSRAHAVAFALRVGAI